MRLKIVLVLFFTTTIIHAQVLKLDKTDIYKAATIPNELLTKQASAVMREYNETYTYTAPDKATSRIRYIVTILKKEGEKWAECGVFYNKLRKIAHFSGKLYDSEGKFVKKLKSSDIQDIAIGSDSDFATDHRAKVAEFNFGQFPYTVEFEYETACNSQIGMESWSPQTIPTLAVENASFEVRTPHTETVRFKTYNFDKPEPVTLKQTEDGQLYNIYQWSAQNMKAFTPEAYTSNSKISQPTVIVVMEHFKMQGYEGSNANWQDLGKFFYELNQERDKLPEPFVAQIKELVKDCPTPLSKVEKLYDYLQKNTRYVSIQLGIGGLQPFPATDVCSKKYGDCKGLTNFMYAMLKEINIPSYYTLVGAGADHLPLQNDLVGDYFNHVFLAVPMEQDTVWLECTSQTNPVGYCSDFTGDREVLMITPEGGKVVRTPSYKEKENVQLRKAVLTLDTEGGATAELETRYSGLQHDLPGALASHSNEKDVRDFLYRQLKLSSFEIKNMNYAVEKKRIPSVVEKLSLSINKYASKSGKRLFIQPNVFNKYAFTMPSIETSGEQKTRRSEVVAHTMAYTDVDSIEWQLPEGYALEHTPEPVKFQSRFGDYEATVKTEGTKMIYTRRMVVNNKAHPSNTLTELMDFYKNIEKSDKAKVVLVSK